MSFKGYIRQTSEKPNEIPKRIIVQVKISINGTTKSIWFLSIQVKNISSETNTDPKAKSYKINSCKSIQLKP